jgi:hypothetical protein
MIHMRLNVRFCRCHHVRFVLIHSSTGLLLWSLLSLDLVLCSPTALSVVAFM